LTLFNVNKCRPLWPKIKLAEHAGIALADQVNQLRRKTPAVGVLHLPGIKPPTARVSGAILDYKSDSMLKLRVSIIQPANKNFGNQRLQNRSNHHTER
jgi:hypothetical protein